MPLNSYKFVKKVYHEEKGGYEIMEFNELIQARRSIRSYEADRTIDRSMIEEILKAAQQAPTWKNSQTGRYYIVNTPEKMEELRTLLEIPENEEVAAVIALGYREGNAAARPRKDLSEIAFFR
jgi:nitroreductase